MANQRERLQAIPKEEEEEEIERPQRQMTMKDFWRSSIQDEYSVVGQLALEAKLDALMNKMGNNERRMHSALEVGIVDEGERRKSAEEGSNHEGPYQVEEAQYLNANRSYTFKPNLNLPTHYTPALKNHENFSYGGGAQQGQRLGQNLQQYHPS